MGNRVITVLLPSRGKEKDGTPKMCKQVINIKDEVEDSIIPSLVKHIAGKDIMLRGKDYFVNTF